jgi:hypothetical protein
MKATYPNNRGATTSELLMHYEYEQNPVTRAVYRQIIGNRIDEGRKSKKDKRG